MSRVHVIGAGLAGLSAAITATGTGRAVSLYEATAAGGGRCRSYFDAELGMRLDNGNHLLLSGNTSAFAYIDEIGARDCFTGPRNPIFPFMDLKTGRKWTLRPNRGRIPWWVLFADRRVPRTTASEYPRIRLLGRVWDDTVMAEAMRHSSLYWLLLEPLSVAALNTRPHEALACLFGSVLRETLLKGGNACLPRVPKEGLSEALVDPAIATLRERGAEILFNRRITRLVVEHDRVIALGTHDGQIALGADDFVVLAAPPWVAGELLPKITVPNAFESILNVHFKIGVQSVSDVAAAGFIGLVNGTAEWIFVRPDRVSVTVSAANKLIDRRADDLAAEIWRDVVKALDLVGTHANQPPFRVVKERRATIVANFVQEERRPGAETDIGNLLLAGDWTDTRLPGTIEGAIRSGKTAAELIPQARNAAKPIAKKPRIVANVE
ncbi:MAG: hydroxysqualene dehydroxylase HpnE [Acetobacteraceae bacterium]|jgi:squalene-associated FAD-dependent desaturase